MKQETPKIRMVKNKNFTYSLRNLSHNAKDFIRKLLHHDPLERSLPSDMFNHDWFKSLRLEDTAYIRELLESEEKA